jgi:hypothetical protein
MHSTCLMHALYSAVMPSGLSSRAFGPQFARHARAPQNLDASAIGGIKVLKVLTVCACHRHAHINTHTITHTHTPQRLGHSSQLYGASVRATLRKLRPEFWVARMQGRGRSRKHRPEHPNELWPSGPQVIRACAAAPASQPNSFPLFFSSLPVSFVTATGMA